MPTPESYENLSVEELRERLARAETACILYGWSAQTTYGRAGDDIVTQAWMDWAHHVGREHVTPAAHPDLNERRLYQLAADRRRIRHQTLQRIAEERQQRRKEDA